MRENFDIPAAPATHDLVEIVDRITGERTPAVVESMQNGRYVLRFESGAVIPGEVRVRWFDGGAAWQAASQLHHIDDVRWSFELALERDWEPAPMRHSLRAPADNSPLLVKIVKSGVLAQDLLVRTACLDFSDSGCRASWSGLTPRAGDDVQVAWDVDGRDDETDPGWISAHVVRVIGSAFRARQIGLKFEIANEAQAARVRAWRQAWLQQRRRQLSHQRAA